MIRTILAPTDLSVASVAAVRYAAHLATSVGASLHVMHVLADSMSSATLAEMYTALPADYFEGVERSAQETLRAVLTTTRSSAHVCDDAMGHPAEEIMKRLTEEPRIISCVRRRTAAAASAGAAPRSVADKIIRKAHALLLTLRDVPVEGPRPHHAEAGIRERGDLAPIHLQSRAGRVSEGIGRRCMMKTLAEYASPAGDRRRRSRSLVCDIND